MSRLTRRQFIAGSIGLGATASLLALGWARRGDLALSTLPTDQPPQHPGPPPLPPSTARPAMTPLPSLSSAQSHVALVDHYNLRYVEKLENTQTEVAQIKRHLDAARHYGIETYILFARDTFEALLTYDFELDGIGKLGDALPATGRHWTEAIWLREQMAEVIEYARRQGIRLLLHSNQFDFPKEIYALIGERVQGANGQPLCPGREDTWTLYRAKLQELFRLFPDLAGVQVTGDESEMPITDCLCQYCQALSPLDRVNRMTRETIAVAGGREVHMRTWQAMPELQPFDPLEMTRALPPHTFISLKESLGDFLLTSPFETRLIGAGDPTRQIVEFDGWREYDGNNFVPCYLGDHWAERVAACRARGITQFAFRLNWNSNINPLFERPWGNLVNFAVFKAMLQTPALTPDDALRQFIRTTFPPGPSHDALLQFYKFTPDFQRAMYYSDGVYLAHHSRMPRHPEMAREMYAAFPSILRTAEDFDRRRHEVTTAYDTLVGLIGALGDDVPAAWREEMLHGAQITWLTGIGLADVYQAVSEHRGDPTLRARILANDRDWQALDPASYRHMRGAIPLLTLDA